MLTGRFSILACLFHVFAHVAAQEPELADHEHHHHDDVAKRSKFRPILFPHKGKHGLQKCHEAEKCHPNPVELHPLLVAHLKHLAEHFLNARLAAQKQRAHGHAKRKHRIDNGRFQANVEIVLKSHGQATEHHRQHHHQPLAFFQAEFLQHKHQAIHNQCGYHQGRGGGDDVLVARVVSGFVDIEKND